MDEVMHITIAINQELIHLVEVFNRGPLQGLGLDPNDPDGWRHYEWVFYDKGKPSQKGELIHKRSDGAVVLAAKVLRQISE